MKYAFPGKRTVSKEVRFDEKIGENVGYEITENVSGMTLREYYAGQAMAGLTLDLAKDLTMSSDKIIKLVGIQARLAVLSADYLIKALEEHHERKL